MFAIANKLIHGMLYMETFTYGTQIAAHTFSLAASHAVSSDISAPEESGIASRKTLMPTRVRLDVDGRPESEGIEGFEEFTERDDDADERLSPSGYPIQSLPMGFHRNWHCWHLMN